jgi:dolichol-phosphate mannosyltransferase
MSINFSIVIPIYNEEENLQELYCRLTAVLVNLCNEDGLPPLSYEIILVDDGSTDSSWQVIKSLHEKDSRLKGISFSRNFGHHIAITAGLDYASGKAVVLMDGDLQDPPEEIPKLYAKFKDGYDIVFAIREKRNDKLFKRFSSWLFVRTLKRISNVEIDLDSGIFRIMSSRSVSGMRRFTEKSRFLTGMMNWLGYSRIGVPTVRHERYAGQSKYTLFKLIRLAWHGITAFSHFPLQLSIYFGFSVSFISLMAGIYMVYKKLIYDIPLMGYTSIIVSLFFIGGIILLVLGVIGEYIGRIYEEVQNRPLYLIKEELG